MLRDHKINMAKMENQTIQ